MPFKCRSGIISQSLWDTSNCHCMISNINGRVRTFDWFRRQHFHSLTVSSYVIIVSRQRDKIFTKIDKGLIKIQLLSACLNSLFYARHRYIFINAIKGLKQKSKENVGNIQRVRNGQSQTRNRIFFDFSVVNFKWYF